MSVQNIKGANLSTGEDPALQPSAALLHDLPSNPSDAMFDTPPRSRAPSLRDSAPPPLPRRAIPFLVGFVLLGMATAFSCAPEELPRCTDASECPVGDRCTIRTGECGAPCDVASCSGFACDDDANACHLRCERAEDCQPGFSCNAPSGACVATASCMLDADCADSFACLPTGLCAERCFSAEECAVGSACDWNTGRCLPASP